MQLSPRWDFRHWSRVGSITNRTAVYGSVRTVVWEGRRSDPSPYPDRIGTYGSKTAPSLARLRMVVLRIQSVASYADDTACEAPPAYATKETDLLIPYSSRR